MTQRSSSEDQRIKHELPDPDRWVDEFGDVLYRYALSRLRGKHEAEEAVQDTLLAAWRHRERFAGRSHPQTWLLGIMKHQVLNRLRSRARQPPAARLDDLDLWFDGRGKWRQPPGRWADPADRAQQADFWRVLRRCLRRLPARMAEAFTLRTLDECDPQTICRELNVSTSNLWVLLHRARLRLVSCLRINWFNAEDD